MHVNKYTPALLARPLMRAIETKQPIIVSSTRRKVGDGAARSSRVMARLSNVMVLPILITSMALLLPWSFLDCLCSVVDSLGVRTSFKRCVSQPRRTTLTPVAPVDRTGLICAHVAGRPVQSPSAVHVLARCYGHAPTHTCSKLMTLQSQSHGWVEIDPYNKVVRDSVCM